MGQQLYPRRLIEADLPIKRISTHARREKAIRHGHISTLQIWWARRPLAACRAVLCATLWLDPCDPLCPPEFFEIAKTTMRNWAKNHAKLVSNESLKRILRIQKDPTIIDSAPELQLALLDFIADFSNWDSSIRPEYHATARTLTAGAHAALGGVEGTRPLVIDLFAGGGSIPLESLRVGADAYAGELNSVAALINKVLIEFIPTYGNRLADGVRVWGEHLVARASKDLEEFFPHDEDGSIPIAYIWARTIKCEGPKCGVEIPLFRSPWLSKKSKSKVALEMDKVGLKRGQINFKIIEVPASGAVGEGTIRRSSATCPCCGYTTAADNVRQQLKLRQGGAIDARLICVVTRNPNVRGRSFRLPTTADIDIVERSISQLEKLNGRSESDVNLVPNEELPYLRSIFNIHLLGVTEWGQLFSPRQQLALVLMIDALKVTHADILKREDVEFAQAVTTCLSFAINSCADHNATLCAWRPNSLDVGHVFGRQAMPITWDFAETVSIGDSTGSLKGAINKVARVIDRESHIDHSGTAICASATDCPLPDDSAAVLLTDPPYYDAIPYADLSDFFYVWLKRMVADFYPDLFDRELTQKRGEIVQLAERNPKYSYKTHEYFESLMQKAMEEARRVVAPNGIGVVVFAHKGTAGWEAQLKAMINAGWIITGSWPIDTELPTRLHGMNSAVLGSSINIVCRPREIPDGSLDNDEIGDWREILQELPKRIHKWMPRLADEGVVGADAIFACLGPALEIFSRFSVVERIDGTVVDLREYLENVWAAVSKEALDMVFEGADASGFEEDARLTAMWLWTLSTGQSAIGDDENESKDKKRHFGGYTLEYDAARKIAQGLGIHMEGLVHLVEIKGNIARLLPVAERTKQLFGKDQNRARTGREGRKKQTQSDFFEEIKNAESAVDWGVTGAPTPGSSILDRVHQGMILFAAGRGEALKQFLAEEGTGSDPRFWSLAQALSALYPAQNEEKRWVDGLLGRKKSFGH